MQIRLPWPNRVVEPSFSDLGDLARRMHVWAGASDANRKAAESIWAAHPGESLESGVTTFKFNCDDSPEQILLTVIEAVDLHHGQYSHDPPWTVLEVFGASPTEEVLAAFRGYGVLRIEETPHGFNAFREERRAV